MKESESTKEKKESIVAIDSENLDREWIKQPELVLKYSQKVADLRLEHARYKANLDIVSSELSKRIRLHPLKFGVDKTTETAVANAIILTTEYKEALELLNKAKHNLDMFQAIVDALEHKKRALESLVTLHGQGYFSKPKASMEAQQELDRQTIKKVFKKG